LIQSLKLRSQAEIMEAVIAPTVSWLSVPKTSVGLPVTDRLSRAGLIQSSSAMRLGCRPRRPSRFGSGATLTSNRRDTLPLRTDNSKVCPPLAATRKPQSVQCQAILSSAFRIA
jgi:hypothetical protein